jgi:cell division protein ZapA
MSEPAQTLDVNILGRAYQVACREEEREHLLSAVAYVNRKMQEIRSATNATNAERVAVMAALNIAHELVSLKLPGGFDVAGLRSKIESMSASIDQALVRQDRLF